MRSGPKRRLPMPRQRSVRSAAAVLLCFCTYFLRGRHGIPFYSVIASLQCIQPYQESARSVGKNRLIGTAVGAFWGLALLLLQPYLPDPGEATLFFYAVLSFTAGLVIYSTVLLGVQQTAYFSAVVFLSITVNHITDDNPFLFVWNRAVDTLIGVAMALLVNWIHLPRKRNLDTLFVSSVDDTLLFSGSALSPYSKVELNRLLDQGARFTISTNRTPARIREILPGIRWQLPVIAMDGAVLYDMRSNTYLSTHLMDPDPTEQLLAFLQERDIHPFANTVLQDVLVICYDRLDNEAQQAIYSRRKQSPYRNYLRMPVPVSENIAYLFLVEKKARMDALAAELPQQSWWQHFRLVRYDLEEDLEQLGDYAYMKIYDRNATRENMLRELQTRLNLSRTVTFGSIEGKYDVVIRKGSRDAMVHQLKKLFTPVR